MDPGAPVPGNFAHLKAGARPRGLNGLWPGNYPKITVLERKTGMTCEAPLPARDRRITDGCREPSSGIVEHVGDAGQTASVGLGPRLGLPG
jgi:hypothetical protein